MVILKPKCLLVHGLTGSPANMEPVASCLREAGFEVVCPQMAGHESVAALQKSRWEDWYHSAAAALDGLTQDGTPAFYVGLSMGGLLGLKLAAEFPQKIRALALLGLPLQLNPLAEVLSIPLVRYTPLRLFIRSVRKNFEKSVADPQGRGLYRKTSLDRFPSHAVFEFKDLIREVRPLLPKVTQPILMIHGKDDRVAMPTSCEILRREVGAAVVEWSMQEGVRHVLTRDYERQRTASRVLGFFLNCA